MQELFTPQCQKKGRIIMNKAHHIYAFGVGMHSLYLLIHTYQHSVTEK